jgi:hypothetical protein
VWCLIADVSKHCFYSIFIGDWISIHLRRWTKHSVPKRRLLSGYPLAFEDRTYSDPKRRLVSGYPLAYKDGTRSVPKRWLLSGYPLTYGDENVPKRLILSVYPLAYEHGTVFRNVGY